MFGDKGRTRRQWLPLLALAACAWVALACGAALSQGLPDTPPAPAAASVPGTPGHLDDGEFAFDYPADWAVIAGSDHGAEGVAYVIAVLGEGSWQESCRHGSSATMTWMQCGTDAVSVPPGGFVVKIFRWYGGPYVPCRGDTRANATAGPNAVRQRVDGDLHSWEIRFPGNEFGQPNNVFVEVRTADSRRVQEAFALVGSFRFLRAGSGGECATAGG
jgi:hypothetical protein